MPRTYEEARSVALELPYEDRAKLSEELWWSLHPPAEELPQEAIDAAWDAGIERRIREIDSGTAELIPAEQVLAEMDAKLAGLRAGGGNRRRPRK